MTRLTRWNRPTRNLSSLQREVNDLFEDFFPTRDSDEGEHRSAVWSPRVDISETEDSHVISMDLPGLTKDDVEITLENNVLKVSGEREMSREEKEGDYSRIERSYGRFFRSFNLGQGVDPAEIEATHENGVLTIRLPKTEREKTKKIEIT